MRFAPHRIAYYTVSVLLLLWPALLNGYPIIFTDTISYMEAGNRIALALKGVPISYFGDRSEFYSASLYLLHLRRSLWPPVMVAALLAAWSIDRLCEVLNLNMDYLSKLRLVAGLAVLTSLPWRVSFVMPDLLAGLMIIWAFLLSLESGALSNRERIALSALLWYGCVCHASHLLLLAGGAVLVAPFRLPGRKRLLAILLVACLSQMACHKVLYGKASLFGHGPPFLLARSLADGPGILYATEHPEYTVSKYLQYARNRSEEDILWHAGGLIPEVRKTSPEDVEKMKKEELRFVVGAFFSHPLVQFGASARNFATQLAYFGLGVEYRTHPYIEWKIDSVLRRGDEIFGSTLQRENRLPTLLFSAVQGLALIIATILFLRYRFWQEEEPVLRRWMAFVVLGILLNAFITGVISGAFARYHSRVVWLIPLCAFTLVKSRQLEGLPGCSEK